MRSFTAANDLLSPRKEVLFLDTSFVVALEMARDNHHAAAARYWRAYVKNPQPLLTTDMVFAEIVTFFNARGLHSKAVEVGGRFILVAGPVGSSLPSCTFVLFQTLNCITRRNYGYPVESLEHE